MGIGSVMNGYGTGYALYGTGSRANAGSAAGSSPSDVTAAESDAAAADGSTDEAAGVVLNPGESTKRAPGRKSSPAECRTCAERKYQDGSDENVSFKTPSHIAPGNAATAVMGHEQEHVTNAYAKARSNNGVVEKCSVSIKTAICPECGRTYVAGGETDTQIKYYNEDNPYQQDMKSSDAVNKYRGANVDLAA